MLSSICIVKCIEVKNVTALQILVSGILLGGIYALISGGLNLIFGVIKVVNMAHDEFLVLGIYAAYFTWK